MGGIEQAIFGLACGGGAGMALVTFAAIVWNRPNAAMVSCGITGGLIGVAAMMAVSV